MKPLQGSVSQNDGNENLQKHVDAHREEIESKINAIQSDFRTIKAVKEDSINRVDWKNEIGNALIVQQKKRDADTEELSRCKQIISNLKNKIEELEIRIVVDDVTFSSQEEMDKARELLMEKKDLFSYYDGHRKTLDQKVNTEIDAKEADKSDLKDSLRKLKIEQEKLGEAERLNQKDFDMLTNSYRNKQFRH